MFYLLESAAMMINDCWSDSDCYIYSVSVVLWWCGNISVTSFQFMESMIPQNLSPKSNSEELKCILIVVMILVEA